MLKRKPPEREEPAGFKGAHHDPDRGGGYAYRHRDDYCAAVRAAARRYPGGEAFAPFLHEHVRTGEPLRLPTIEHPYPQGPVASFAAAQIGAASGPLPGATAAREAWRRARPPTTAFGAEKFKLNVRPDT